MRAKPIYKRDEISLAECCEEYVDCAKQAVENLSKTLHTAEVSSNVKLLERDITVAFDYGINRACTVGSERVSLEEVKPFLSRFLKVGSLTWKTNPQLKQFHRLNEDNKRRTEETYYKRVLVSCLQILHRSYVKDASKSTLTKMLLTADELGIKINPENEDIITQDIYEHIFHDYGDYLDWSDSQDHTDFVKQSSPGFTCNMLSDLVKARFTLDFGIAISLTELSLLAEVSRRSITNALNSKDSELEIKTGLMKEKIKVTDDWFDCKEYRIKKKSALTWLEKRGSFKPTAHSDLEGEHYPLKLGNPDDYFQVPRARDGSVFSPDCSTRNGFMIGPKGSEVQYKNFEEALEELKQMKKPYWRRRNSKGRFGIVAGIGWKSIPKSEFFPGKEE